MCPDAEWSRRGVLMAMISRRTVLAGLGAAFSFAQQDELLERAFDLARAFNTDRIRVFDFWRLDDQAPHRQAIDEVVRAAAAKAGKRGLTLVLENEYACNTATGAEAGRL